MRMAYIIPEMSTFAANITFSHLYTSFIATQHLYNSRKYSELQAENIYFWS